MKYICPKGVVIRFEEEILFLIELAVEKDYVCASFDPVCSPIGGFLEHRKVKGNRSTPEISWEFTGFIFRYILQLNGPHLRDPETVSTFISMDLDNELQPIRITSNSVRLSNISV